MTSAKRAVSMDDALTLLVSVSVIIYVYWSFLLIEDFYQKLQPVLMDRPRHKLRWLSRLLKAVTGLWLLWLPYTIIDYLGYHDRLGLLAYYPFYLFFAVMVIWIAAASFLRSHAGLVYTNALETKATVPVELKQKGALLKQILKENRYYEDPELSLVSLSEKLNLTTHELSRIINTAIKKSFSDFINEYRVREVIRKMQDPTYDHLTLFGIAYDSGFNSKTNFNRAFRQLTGKSAGEYKTGLKKDSPFYNNGLKPVNKPLTLRPETASVWSQQKSKHNFMFRNYLKIAWRNIIRNKTFSFINIFGLGLGTAASLLIFLWVQDELAVDAFHKNGANIYTVYEREFSDGKINGGLWTQGLLAGELKKKFPEIHYATGFDNQQNNSATFSSGEKNITIKGAAADTDFFKIFDYKLLEGNPGGVLRNPDEIIISRRMAESFFGTVSAAMNKTIRYNDSRDFRISAVYENVPAKSSDQFDYIVNWEFHLKDVGWLTNWVYRTPRTYLTLYPGSDPVKVEAKIKDFLSSYITEKKAGGYRLELGLQRFDKMYLYSSFKNGIPSEGRIEYVHLFSMIAVFILLIACINFMNLSTARSVKRAKEVGVRKTIGALRSSLVIQFISEALLFAFFAILAAIVLVIFVLPEFNTITGKQIVLSASQPSLWFALVSLMLVIGFVAGSYPALFLSSLNPVKVLKGSLKFSFGALFFRKGLVVFQFALSIILIIGTMVIAKQINFVQNQNLGFSRENLVYVPFQGDMAVHQYGVFKQELAGMPGIKGITRADQAPTGIHAHVYDTQWAGKDPNEKTIVIHTTVGYGYLKLMNLQLLQGTDFRGGFTNKDSLQDHAEKAGYIINETALKLTGYKDPIGMPLGVFGGMGKIIGVVKDFHFGSLHEPIRPLIILLTDDLSWGFAIIRTEPGKTREAIASIEKVYKKLEPKFPFTYSFAEADYQHLYDSEQIVGKLSSAFAFLAVFISCLGLLGLVMFTAEQRTKEIGVRKVLGASEITIFRMLSFDFIQLIGIAFAVASPIAWLIMNNWLLDYAYRTTISWWLFGGAGFVTLCIALITISFQAIRAAWANPVKSLRNE